MKDGWKPQLRGDIYCSPACGRGCTKAEYDRAVKRADKLAKKLGPGWKPEVFENLGWFSMATSPCGRITVHPPDTAEGYYDAFLNKAGEVGGLWTVSASTPKQAVAKVIEAGKRHLAEIQAIMEGL